MSMQPKVQLFGIDVSVTDYDSASAEILSSARKGQSFAVSALAVHGLMEAVADPEFASVVSQIDLVTPDGQPVRWAMNRLCGTQLRERVYGPELTARVCALAAREGIGVFLFGSTPDTCARMDAELKRRYPGIQVVGVQSDRFREATPEEDVADVRRINASGAGVVLVGRGCPRQERWVAQHRGQVNAAMLAVGAAFDYFAGNLRPTPPWMQRAGLQWLHRLVQEPRRLFRRYLVTNTRFLYLLARHHVRSLDLGGGRAE